MSARARGRRVLRILVLLAMWVVTVTLALPPYSLWPFGLVAVVPLLVALRSTTSGWRALGLGWLFGWVVNVAGYLWGIGLLTRFTEMSTALALGAVSLVCAYQALVWALWAWLCVLLTRGRDPSSWLLVAPLAIVVCEAAVPMVFPWQLGILVARAWPLTQIAELGGPVAVSALVVSINVAVVHTAGLVMRRERPEPPLMRACVVIGFVIGAGLIRALHVASVRRDAPKLRVAIVQPNFGITSIEARSRRGQTYVEVLRQATAEAASRGAELVVWPESAFPFLFDRALDHTYAPGHPWELAPQYRGRLLFGALTHQFGDAGVFNSAVLVAGDGSVRGIYDKTQLLVFGEYIPMADRFPEWAASMRASLPDWPEIIPGGGPSLLVDGDLRIAPLICYEDILPEHVHAAARADANLLVTIANHAWFGDSVAARQAEALALLRGVETRRDLVRATNTGVSSVSDGLGRTHVETELYAVDPEHPPPYELAVADVALLDLPALAPYTARWFPWGAAALLAVVLARRVRERTLRGRSSPSDPPR